MLITIIHCNIINIVYFVRIFPGALGCRFLSKRKILNGVPNELNDMVFKLYVGADLVIDGFQFVLTDVEDRTLRFMMDHSKELVSLRYYTCNRYNL